MMEKQAPRMPFFMDLLFNRSSSIVHRKLLASFLSLLLLLLSSCGRYKVRHELAQNELFAEILKREDRRWIGTDRFFESNLANPNPEVRQWSAIAMGRIACPQALPFLYGALHAGDAAGRAASAFAIGEIEDRELLAEQHLAMDPAAAAELTRLLDDSSITVRMRAVEALGKIGSPEEGIEITRRLEHFHYNRLPAERAYLEASITALVRLKAREALPVIERLAETSDPEIMWRARDALLRLRSDTEDPLVVRNPKDPGPSGGYCTEAFRYALAETRKNSTIARLETNRGDIEIELFREDAPVTVASFVLEASRGLYNGLEFVQTVPSQLIEGKVPYTREGPGSTIKSEINMRPFERGSIGLAIAGRNSDLGRFFIALAPQPYLDGVHTCFGRVISGMQVADRIVPGDRVRKILIRETISTLDYHRY